MKTYYILLAFLVSCSTGPKDDCIQKEIERMGLGQVTKVNIISSEEVSRISGQQSYDFWMNRINDGNFHKDTLVAKIEAMLSDFDGTPEEFRQWKFRLEQIKNVGHGYQVKKVHYTAHNGVTGLEMDNTFYFMMNGCEAILQFDADEYRKAESETKSTDSLQVLEYMRFVDGIN